MHSPPAWESKLIANTAPSRSAEERRVNLLILCGLALVIGVMTGFGAVVFRALIALVHNASYSGRLSFVYATRARNVFMVSLIAATGVPSLEILRGTRSPLLC